MFDGKRLRILRKDKKLTQVELGNIFNISHATINRYENGINEPDTKLIGKFADFFNVSVDYLLNRTDNPNHAIIEKEELPAELIELGYDYIVVLKEAKSTGLTADELRDLISFANKMKN